MSPLDYSGMRAIEASLVAIATKGQEQSFDLHQSAALESSYRVSNGTCELWSLVMSAKVANVAEQPAEA